MNLSKFQRGDKVKVDGHGFAHIVEVYPPLWGDHFFSYKIRLEANGLTTLIDECFIRLLVPKNEPKCECGAHHTSAPDDHLTYCPLHVKIVL